MNRSGIELSYRRTALEGASAIGLVIALYDTMAGNLRRAANALRDNDIETRCKELNHAALVLGQLEDWVDPVNGGDLAKSLSTFYSYLRAMIMQASAGKSAELLDAQIALILQVRSAWQQRDTTIQPPSDMVPSESVVAPMPQVERRSFSMSA